MSDFVPFPKIPRLRRGMIVTEKLDGTNAQIVVGEDGSVRAGSRNRWLPVGGGQGDNAGFAGWVAEHEDELRDGLGPGRHFGEWYGQKIGRTYGLAERRLALFNTTRWDGTTPERTPPACCSVVPVLLRWDFCTSAIDDAVNELAALGSRAVPGYMRPEGVVVYHVASGQTFKRLCEGDELPKGVTPRAERDLDAERAA